MRRGLSVLAISLVLALSAAGPAGADAASLRIRKIDQSHFPRVTLTVSVGGPASVDPKDFKVTENGAAVTPDDFRSLSSTGQQVDVVLAIDTSNSVRGAPLASAVAAAKAFLDRLPDSIPVGLVTFDATSRIVLPITTDHAAVAQALDSLSTRSGTALYAAVEVAAGMFSGSGQHNILLLTDGANTQAGSLDAAIAAATRSGANVFTVGLASEALKVDVLQKLADETSAGYVPATQADVAAIYDRLGSELSHQYVLTYTSTASRGAEVSISVSLQGASDTSLVIAPTLPAPPLAAPGSSQPLAIRGTAGLVTVLVLAFLATFVLFLMILGTNARSRRHRELARRLAVGDGEPLVRSTPVRPDAGLAVWMPEPVVGVAQRVAAAGGFAESLDRRLDLAGLPVRAGEFLAGSVALALVGGGLGQIVLGSLPFALLLAAVGGAVPAVLLSIAIGRRTARLHAQLADVVAILASSLRAGHSFFQALDIVSKEVSDPAGPEFQRVVAEVRLGRPVEDALAAMAARIGSEDFKWAVLAVNIQREVGGNLAEVLDIVAETVRERETIRRQVRVLSAEGRLSVKILVALPFLIAFFVFRINPDYMNLLFTTRLGWILLGTGAALMTLGIIWARKVVRIDV